MPSTASPSQSTLPYERAEAKEWARNNLKGVCNVTMPSFTADFSQLNESAIAHDVRHCAELGFSGTLLVSECGTTLDEYRRFVQVAAEAAPDDFQLLIHGSFNSREETLEACRAGEQHGAVACLLAYDPNFFPADENDVYMYTEEVAKATDLGLIIFAVTTWGFARFHPSQFSPMLIERMAGLETAIAVKYEANHPGLVTGMSEVVRRVGDMIVVSDPMEFNGPGWIDLFQMQWMGTSSYEFFGERVPGWFSLMHEGRREEALELYWSYAPARKARGAMHASIAGAKLIHRPAWKYMAWLQGFNGGPLRMPQMRMDAALMRSMREGLQASGFELSDEPDELFFRGRHES